MAIPTCIELVPPPAYWDASGLNFARRFSVVARTVNDAYAVLQTQTGIARGTSFTDGVTTDPLYCVCKTILVEQRTPAPSGGTGLFDVTALYGFPAIFIQPPRPPDTTVRYRTEQGMATETFDTDKDGKPIVNTAGTPITGLTTLTPQIVLVGDWTIFAPDYASAFNRVCWPYMGKVNSATFQGAAKDCLLCIDVHIEQANIAYNNPGQYPFSVTARWQFKPQVYVYNALANTTGWEGGWRRIEANLGLRYRTAQGAATTLPFKDAEGNLISDPLYLNTYGTNSGPISTQYTPCVVYDEYPSADFNSQVTA